MRKFLPILAAIAFALSLLVPSIRVSATSVCPSGFTGPDSDNICKSIKKFTCNVENDTFTVINNENNQVAVSGGSLSSDNTSGGDARTGSATNSNKVTFKVNVNNENVCQVAVTTPAVPQGQGAAGGGGGGGGAGAIAAPSQVTPSVLPNTGSDVVTSYLTFVAESLGIGVVAASIAAVLYRRWQV
jgi:hypothetical protein